MRLTQLIFLLPALMLAMLLTTQPVSAATIYASEVKFADCNTTCGGVGRDDPLAALGAANGDFYSMGRGGELIVGFGQTFAGPGTVFEVTNGNVAGYGVESVDVYVGDFLSNTWTKVATVLNTAAQTGFSFNFVGTFDSMRLVDTTPANCTTSSSCNGDGFDVAAIGVSVVPLPASGLLLLGGLGGFAALKRRRKRATLA